MLRRSELHGPTARCRSTAAGARSSDLASVFRRVLPPENAHRGVSLQSYAKAANPEPGVSSGPWGGSQLASAAYVCHDLLCCGESLQPGWKLLPSLYVGNPLAGVSGKKNPAFLSQFAAPVSEPPHCLSCFSLFILAWKAVRAFSFLSRLWSLRLYAYDRGALSSRSSAARTV